MHTYAGSGAFLTSLYATPHYDDDQKPGGSAKQVLAEAGSPEKPGNIADVFPDQRSVVAMKTDAQPRAREPLVCIISYRNNSTYTTDGRLHLFFNEKKFKVSHFNLQNARTPFGETDESTLGAAGPPPILDWEALLEGWSGTGESAAPWRAYTPLRSATELLEKARDEYRDERSWRYTLLKPGEKRNLFVTFLATPSMLQDTSAFIHLKAVLEPFDPAVPPAEFTLEIEIVSSHDPNLIAVSDNRVNYRRLAGETLDYKVRFQNNGEEPAKKIELSVTIPEGLNHGKMLPIDWYPRCPICPETPVAGGCLDTATTKDKLIFTFRDIYLPGSRQKGVSDYDSTQGFVRYRIRPHKGMPKKAFRSQAAIVFDKNKPIYTNFSKTRFRPGLSPGLKAGYGFRPDSAQSGYFFMGASLSPYKSWKFYPQIELLAGLKGRSEFEEPTQTQYFPFDSSALGQKLYDTLIETSVKGSRGWFSLEMPLLLRKNFTRFLGAGIGVSATFLISDEDRTKTQKTTVTLYGWTDSPTGIVFLPSESETQTASTTQSATETRVRWSVFADLTLGSVRAGPNVGIRAGGISDGGFQPFVQVSFEIKL